ncbi:dTDP-glucose 4,6-dehydratase [Streptomyces sp. ADI96-02]|uniref:dTDP-glucose 4,6-dehydratase n=1 Tax=Streptomyces sp. ADI96-02 TaxID=1522760 RepID=UPI000F54FD53|nr:dTDP-glucose 4,6-dehydratase [Streptomyces sp. ADI96-02]RPK56957.1 dTDP-glucose 4,6-dehydratase [Streptomyces sp. ADI96-02]
MRLLVTGAAGFIGSHYVRTLLDGNRPGFTDTRVTVLDALTYAGDRTNLPERHPRLTFVHGDICDLPLLLDLLPGHDAVVHFAAESHVDRSLVDASAFIRTNVTGTEALLHACLRTGVQRVVHVSTDEVYGSIERGSWTEEWPLVPNSPYAASKAASDLVALSYVRSHGLDLSVTRCSNNYGPYQHVEKLIPAFTTRLLEWQPVPLYGDGSHTREWVHVSDHCDGVHLVLTRGRAGEVYNIGGGDERTNRDVAGALLDLCGAPPTLLGYVADRKGHDQRYSLDDTKIREQLGYAPRIAFEEGLAQTVAWYREHPERWRHSPHTRPVGAAVSTAEQGRAFDNTGTR